MKIDSSLMTKLPGYHVGLGLAFFGLGLMAKHILPQAIGSLRIIQLPCAFFSAVLVPLGSLLALRALILTNTSRKSLLSCHLLGLAFVLVMLSMYFYMFLMLKSVLELDPHYQFQSLLPKLAENARSLPTEQKRLFQARWAYRLYGTIIAYRLDNLDVAYFVPTEEDKSFWRKQEQSNAQIKTSIAFIKNQINQFPYLFGLYVATYLATFVVGGIWLVIRMPKDSPMAAS